MMFYKQLIFYNQLKFCSVLKFLVYYYSRTILIFPSKILSIFHRGTMLWPLYELQFCQGYQQRNNSGHTSSHKKTREVHPCNSRMDTRSVMFVPAQILRNRSDQRPSNLSDLGSSVTVGSWENVMRDCR